MTPGSVGSRRARFFAIVGMVGAVAVTLTATISPAEAARKKKRQAGGYTPPYAALVVDAKTGRTLHAVNEDAPRIPASLTKVMTLYLLFEQLERGRVSMDSELKVSANAARQAPSKIGFRPGQTIEVKDAILALITKSANDVAMTVAENIGGSEDEFARMMTARARSLGMSRTTFYNPHGLPHNPPNITTARDLAVLGRAIQDRFPRYYPMFSTRVFNFEGRGSYRNHNKLLGRVEGVDGIKTGYTNASGFNLITSAKADGRHLVSVVLGGRSGAARDKIMADLVVANLPKAAGGARTAPMIAEAPTPMPAPAARPERAERAEAPTVAALPTPRPRVEPEPPAVARAYAAAPTTTPTSAPMPVPRAVIGNAQPLQLSGMRAVTATTTPSAMRWSIGQPPADGKVLRPPADVDTTSSIAKAAEAAPAVQVASLAEPVAQPQQRKVEARLPDPTPRSAATAIAKADAKPAEVKVETKVAENRPGSKWVIQLGATDDEAKAKDIIARARAKASGPLADASGFTEKVEKGGSTLFRARFAGFADPKDAQNACAKLKRDGFACFATRG